MDFSFLLLKKIYVSVETSEKKIENFNLYGHYKVN